ncbi:MULTISPECIES: PQQ-binding-like beta-propeller repeat protein [unclassified Streptomyces]
MRGEHRPGVQQTPTVAGGSVYVGSGDDSLYAIHI